MIPLLLDRIQTVVVAYHSKVGNIVFAAVVVYHFVEVSVQTFSLSWLNGESTATASPWCHQLSLGFMRCQHTRKSYGLQLFQAARGAGDSFPEQRSDHPRWQYSRSELPEKLCTLPIQGRRRPSHFPFNRRNLCEICLYSTLTMPH